MTHEPMPERDYVPPLGRSDLTGQYDRAIALMTREKRWRSELIDRIPDAAGQLIVDVGCGTGTLAVGVAAARPGCEIIGIDPDAPALDLARNKAREAGVAIRWQQAMGDRVDAIVGAAGCDVILSTLMFHQCELETKQAIADAMFRALKPGGRLLVADYGLQRSLLMRTLFRQVQMLDGFDKTEPNAKGCMPGIFEAAGFAGVGEPRVIPTPSGSTSIYEAWRPAV
jgi:ubiquinone/menaquinone biosynthesis C-methylase UbiE